MSQPFKISEIGFRLIKAYEGLRAEPLMLPDGRVLIGYGHLTDALGAEARLDDEAAEDLLRDDLTLIETTVNNALYASVTQSQFDALCSFAFSVGPQAFLQSRILKDINRGRIIRAANGFDAWTKGKIDGQTYIIDALVRRRTAEKALFLRPTHRTARAPRYELTALRDGMPITDTADTALPVFDTPEPDRTVTVIDVPKPAEQVNTPVADNTSSPDGLRKPLRQPDGPTLYSDEIPHTAPAVADVTPTTPQDLIVSAPEQNTQDIEAAIGALGDKTAQEPVPPMPQAPAEPPRTTGPEEPPMPSPIASAAAEVSRRLDALIDYDTRQEASAPTVPDSLLRQPTHAPTQSVATPAQQPVISDRAPDKIIDALTQDDALRDSLPTDVATAETFVDDTDRLPVKRDTPLAFIAMIIGGLISALVGLGINMRGAVATLGADGPFITGAAVLIGVLLFIAGTYYLLKHIYAGD